jgi:hypothetical protein
VELPGGNDYNKGDDIKMVIVVRDPDGVNTFTWGIFMQNQSPLPIGGTESCNGSAECRAEVKASPPVAGTYLIGVDAIDGTGERSTGFVGEVYVN